MFKKDPFIRVYRDFDLCTEEYLKELKASNSWKRATVGMEHRVSDVRTNDFLVISGREEFKRLDQKLFQLFHAAILRYRSDIPVSDFGITKDEGYQALRYESGQEYKRHSDQGTLNQRMVSAVLFLNENFKGGKLWFPNQKVKVTPKAGTVVLFPSSFAYEHVALPVKKGVKFAVVTWFK